MADSRLQQIILESENNDWVSCTGYRLLSHSMESFVKKMDEIRDESQSGDKQILDKLDSISDTICLNKDDGNDRASSTNERIARLETSVATMSDTMKWMIRTVFFGVGVFILQQIGVIEWITQLIKSIFT